MALPSLENDPFLTERNSIPYIELPLTNERFVNDGTEAVRRLACYAKDRVQFITDMMEDARIQGGKLRRDLAETHPWYESFRCVELQLVGSGGWPDYDSANNDGLTFSDSPPTGTSPLRAQNGEGVLIWLAVYRPPVGYDVKSDADADGDALLERSRYCRVTVEGAGDQLPIVKGALHFEGDSPNNTLREEAHAALYVSAPIFNVEWLCLPRELECPQTWYGYWNGTKLIHGAVGSVNKNDFYLPGHGTFKAGSLLCLAPQVRYFQHANTGVMKDMVWPLQMRPQTHSRFLRADGSWERVLRKTPDTDWVAVFPEFPFEDIFDPSKP